MTTLPLRIALRYLFSRKSYHVINMISGIGAAGMAIGTAALVVILSVFNGFDSLVSQSLTDAHPDLVIKPATGKVFRPDSLSWLVEEPSIVRLSSVLEDQAFLSCDGKQGLVLVKGVDLAAEEESPLKAHMIDGVWQLHRGDRAMAVAGAGLAAQLGLNPRFLAPLELHYPSRTEAISLANPAASLRSVKLGLAGVLSVSSELDAKLLVVPIGTVRELLGYETEVSALEIWAAPEQAQTLQKALQERLGTHFRVLDRYQQNASVYKMMRYEKLAIFLILIFVVLIIAFNIYSSLRMLVIEKEADIATLHTSCFLAYGSSSSPRSESVMTLFIGQSDSCSSCSPSQVTVTSCGVPSVPGIVTSGIPEVKYILPFSVERLIVLIAIFSFRQRYEDTLQTKNTTKKNGGASSRRTTGTNVSKNY